MIDDVVLRWAVTLAFLVACAAFLPRTFAATLGGVRIGPSERISSLAHLAMCVAMIAMAWPWGMGVPAMPQYVVFGAAAVWFLARAVSRTERRPESARGLSPHAHHALMMVGMIWMVAIMPAAMAAPGPEGGGHHHGLAALGEPAPGRLSWGPDGAVDPLAAGHAGHGTGEELALPLVLVTLAAGLYFILSSLRWIAAAVDAAQVALTPVSVPAAAAAGAPAGSPGAGAPRLAAFDAGCHAAMSIGMGVMLLVML